MFLTPINGVVYFCPTVLDCDFHAVRSIVLYLLYLIEMQKMKMRSLTFFTVHVYSLNLSLPMQCVVSITNMNTFTLGSKLSPKQKNSSTVNYLSLQSKRKTSESDAKVIKSVFVADVGWSSQVNTSK